MLLAPPAPESAHNPPSFLSQESWRTLRASSEQAGGVPPAADHVQGDLGYRFPQLDPIEAGSSWPDTPLRSLSENGGCSLIGFSLPSSQSEEWGLFMNGITVSRFLRTAIEQISIFFN